MEVINNGQDMVVIVNGAESFIANGLKSKMNNAGINTIIVGRRIKDVEAYRSIAKLFILFMDDSMNEYQDQPDHEEHEQDFAQFV